jgi:putative ABC transport system permease protein
VLGVVGLGTAGGVLIGVVMGRGLCGLYLDVFHFPEIDFRVGVGGTVGAIAATTITALAGAWGSVRQAAALPPAEAMRPAAPPSYAPSFLERTGLHAHVPPALRMVLRDMERRPWRLLFSSLGISLAVATLIVGRFSHDSLEVVMDLQFNRVQREDLAVSFFDDVDARVLRELALLPGVLRVEGVRDVPARLVFGAMVREVALTGLPPDGTLRRVLDAQGRPARIEGPGLHLSRVLAERMGVEPGDEIEVQVREGDRRVRRVPVRRVIDEQFGLGAYLSQPALAKLMGQEPRFTSALLLVDPREEYLLYRALQALPRVASISRASLARAHFEAQSAQVLRVFTAFLVGFASAIAIGVVYNNARIALAVRSRDLATLRVLGFTRREIATVLLVEAGAGLVLALPLGMLLGRVLAWVTIAAGVDTELFRIPVIVAPPTYAFAVLVTVLAGAASGLLVRRRLDALDLVAVLKARE